MKKDLVLYDGAKSHITQYNFCYLCKERCQDVIEPCAARTRHNKYYDGQPCLMRAK